MIERRGRKLIEDGVLCIEVEQGGFTPKRSCPDSLFLLQCTQDGQRKRWKPLYVGKIDFTKAFDTMRHKLLLPLLRIMYQTDSKGPHHQEDQDRKRRAD